MTTTVICTHPPPHPAVSSTTPVCVCSRMPICASLLMAELTARWCWCWCWCWSRCRSGSGSRSSLCVSLCDRPPPLPSHSSPPAASCPLCSCLRETVHCLYAARAVSDSTGVCAPSELYGHAGWAAQRKSVWFTSASSPENLCVPATTPTCVHHIPPRSKPHARCVRRQQYRVWIGYILSPQHYQAFALSAFTSPGSGWVQRRHDMSRTLYFSVKSLAYFLSSSSPTHTVSRLPMCHRSAGAPAHPSVAQPNCATPARIASVASRAGRGADAPRNEGRSRRAISDVMSSPRPPRHAAARRLQSA
jgi:hypothetical protein